MAARFEKVIRRDAIANDHHPPADATTDDFDQVVTCVVADRLHDVDRGEKQTQAGQFQPTLETAKLRALQDVVQRRDVRHAFQTREQRCRRRRGKPMRVDEIEILRAEFGAHGVDEFLERTSLAHQYELHVDCCEISAKCGNLLDRGHHQRDFEIRNFPGDEWIGVLEIGANSADWPTHYGEHIQMFSLGKCSAAPHDSARARIACSTQGTLNPTPECALGTRSAKCVTKSYGRRLFATSALSHHFGKVCAVYRIRCMPRATSAKARSPRVSGGVLDGPRTARVGPLVVDMPMYQCYFREIRLQGVAERIHVQAERDLHYGAPD